MTEVGAGGVIITAFEPSRRYSKEYRKLTDAMRELVDGKLEDLLSEVRPPGLRFEKLKGESNPDIYSIHVTGNYKITFELNGSTAFLRRVATHDEIDRAP